MLLLRRGRFGHVFAIVVDPGVKLLRLALAIRLQEADQLQRRIILRRPGAVPHAVQKQLVRRLVQRKPRLLRRRRRHGPRGVSIQRLDHLLDRRPPLDHLLDRVAHVRHIKRLPQREYAIGLLGRLNKFPLRQIPLFLRHR
jgi:hypothetical protein